MRKLRTWETFGALAFSLSAILGATACSHAVEEPPIYDPKTEITTTTVSLKEQLQNILNEGMTDFRKELETIRNNDLGYTDPVYINNFQAFEGGVWGVSVFGLEGVSNQTIMITTFDRDTNATTNITIGEVQVEEETGEVSKKLVKQVTTTIASESYSEVTYLTTPELLTEALGEAFDYLEQVSPEVG